MMQADDVLLMIKERARQKFENMVKEEKRKINGVFNEDYIKDGL